MILSAAVITMLYILDHLILKVILYSHVKKVYYMAMSVTTFIYIYVKQIICLSDFILLIPVQMTNEFVVHYIFIYNIRFYDNRMVKYVSKNISLLYWFGMYFEFCFLLLI